MLLIEVWWDWQTQWILFSRRRPSRALSGRPAMIGWYIIGAIGMIMLYSGISAGAMAVVVEREWGSLIE
jgi:hypothetical protein